MENLGRGMVAIRASDRKVFISWRILGTDPDAVSFNLYRKAGNDFPILLNTNGPITGATCFEDTTFSATQSNEYFVRPIIDGVEKPASAPFTLPAAATVQSYLRVPLQIPAGVTTPDGVTCTYSANDCSVGDLDGDGEYEIIVKWDPSNSHDNSSSGYSGNVYLDAYKLDGTRLWRIDLGKNIRAGAHYTQFMVYDLDGDGKAEIACKTTDGTRDGVGTVIGNATADYRNSSGYILSGPEYLTIFNGLTGAAMTTVNYLPARGTVSSWGDTYGNRVDRFLACIAYLDGERPSLVMCRGYYAARTVIAAWDWRDGQLTQRWIFDSNDGTPGNSAYNGQGNHNLSVADVDGDGKDEIVYGSCTIDHNGKGLYSTGLGHGDAMHVAQMNPAKTDLYVWACHENINSNGNIGHSLRNAATGEVPFTKSASEDTGRAMAGDIDPRYPGYEIWGARCNLTNAVTVQEIAAIKPSMNFAVWWDGDLLRELLSDTKIMKWNWNTKVVDTVMDVSPACASNNSTKATPCLSGDILGDWREEVVWREADSAALRIYTTTTHTTYRLRTLMHDRQYREAIAWQNVAYNQPPHPSFFLGHDMAPPPTPNIVTTLADYNTAIGKPTITSASRVIAKAGEDFSYTISAANAASTYAATGLPTGLILDPATGVISGKPTVTGTFAVTLTATNNIGTISATLTLAVAAATAEAHTALVTLAGLAQNQGTADGTTTSARFNSPNALVAHSNGTLYVADTASNSVRAIDASGNVTTLSLSGANLSQPSAIISGSGNTLIIADTGNNAIRSLDLASGRLATLTTQIPQPRGLARDAAGNLYIASTSRHIIQKLASGASAPTPFAGFPDIPGIDDGGANTAHFNNPAALVIAPDGNLYVADKTNHAIRKIDLGTGAITTIAGHPGTSGTTNGIPSLAMFTAPEGITADVAGNLYIADTGNHAIRRIDAITNEVTTVVGLTTHTGTNDGIGTNARLNAPAGLSIDTITGDIYVADTGNHTTRMLLDGPRILKHPENQSIATGGTATFIVLAIGAPNPAYQWDRAGIPIASATNFIYTVANAQTTHAGSYTVSVSNDIRAVTSNAAILSITDTSTGTTSGTTTQLPSNYGNSGSGAGGGATSLSYVFAISGILFLHLLRHKTCAR